ncbi:subunit 9 of transcription initiation factor IID [Hamiltosporidium tvaerminnensis]|uniref:Subunit 9 of transcription initiation factor IID n=1 Tax=Hamiltosporidium tvaerminnensis TaxID=1176355 RepID=A0A4Q9LRJ8_9MICR|nr:subunit 9 of transcription initiation factor IID [Hamiltosporidium tvaerminnensis]
MAAENQAPRDAKVVSLILRSLGIEECEPKVIIQLLEFAYKYSTEILLDAVLYAEHANRKNVTSVDIKLSLQTKVGRHFVPPPPKQYMNEIAVTVNSRPLLMYEDEILLQVPPAKLALFGLEYSVIKKDSETKRRIY